MRTSVSPETRNDRWGVCDTPLHWWCVRLDDMAGWARSLPFRTTSLQDRRFCKDVSSGISPYPGQTRNPNAERSVAKPPQNPKTETRKQTRWDCAAAPLVGAASRSRRCRISGLGLCGGFATPRSSFGLAALLCRLSFVLALLRAVLFVFSAFAGSQVGNSS